MFIYIYIYTYKDLYICICTSILIHIHIHIYIYRYIYIYINMNKNAYCVGRHSFGASVTHQHSITYPPPLWKKKNTHLPSRRLWMHTCVCVCVCVPLVCVCVESGTWQWSDSTWVWGNRRGLVGGYRGALFAQFEHPPCRHRWWYNYKSNGPHICKGWCQNIGEQKLSI